MLQNSSSNLPISPEYVASLERRIIQLENQIQQFDGQLARQQNTVSALGRNLPNTALLSPNFLARAFTVWGHLMVAQLIVVIPIYCLIFAIGFLSNY